MQNPPSGGFCISTKIVARERKRDNLMWIGPRENRGGKK